MTLAEVGAGWGELVKGLQSVGFKVRPVCRLFGSLAVGGDWAPSYNQNERSLAAFFASLRGIQIQNHEEEDLL